jgi:5-methyltetrahydrofolate--homocysteine methyltransferase
LVNSISAEPERLEKLLPIAAKYGAMLVVLPMAGTLPGDAEERKKTAEQIIGAAADYGYQVSDVVIDALAMAVSSDPHAVTTTLDTIEWASRDLNAATVVGLSNTSFGLPGRAWMNASFLSAAAGRGLTAAIANPGEKVVMATKYAADAWRGQDQMAMQYIRYYRAVLSHHEIVRSPKAPEPEPVLRYDGDVCLPDHPEKSAGHMLSRRMVRP